MKWIGAALWLLPLTGMTAGAVEANLRVLGKIQTERRGNETALICETPEKARLTGSKFIADLTGFGDVKARPDGKTFVLDGAGAWRVGTDGKTLRVRFAKNAAELGTENWSACPVGAYPKWFDKFDNRAIACGALGWGILPKDYRPGMEWIGKNRFELIAENNNPNQQLGPQTWDWGVTDFYRTVARRNQTGYQLYLPWAHADYPAYFTDVAPLPYYRAVEGALAHPAIGNQRLTSWSWHEQSAANAELVGRMNRQISERTSADPDFEVHFGATELGHNFILTLPGYAATPNAIAAWRAYLRDVRKLDPAAAGKMIRGRADAFKSWDDIPLPTFREVIDRNPAESLDLRGSWELGVARDATGPFPAADLDKWTVIHCNDPLLLLFHNFPGKVWLRRTVTMKPGQYRYLHISRSAWHGSKTKTFDAFLNGKKLKNLTVEDPLTGDWEMCYELGDTVRDGANELVLDTKGQPIPFYVLLNNFGRFEYPSADPDRNRLLYELTEFCVKFRLQGVENWFKAFRAGDPAGRPILAMAPWDLIDHTFDLFRRYGAFAHDTGQGGACWAPWMARYYMTRGLPVSSEPGGAPSSAVGMRRMITLYILMGNDMANLLFDPTQYGKPDIDAWIQANGELLKCLGKIEMNRPSVGVLRSVRNASRLHQRNAWAWDPSRGALQAAGRTCALVDSSDFARGRVGNWFSTVIDAGTEILTADELRGIEKFCREGGTFIAMQHTGMHSETHQFAWPLGKLAGLEILHNGRGGKLQFSETQTLWPKLRGKTIPGWGQILDWRRHDETGTSVRMKATDPDVEVIATWADRKPAQGNIAIAARKIGKGRVLVLGGSFWRRERDAGGAFQTDRSVQPYLADLLDNLGVPRGSAGHGEPGMESVFAEPWRSKNGVYDLYLTARMNDQAKTAVANPVFPGVAEPKSGVRELSAAGHPAARFAWKSGDLRLPGVSLEPMQLRIFGAPRADLENVPEFWLKTLEKRWYALAPVQAFAEEPKRAAGAPERISLNDGWKIKSTGRIVAFTTFLEMGLPEDSHLIFQREVTVPAAWRGKRVSLGYAAQYWFWGLYPHGRVRVNDELVKAISPGPNGSFVFDLPAGTEKFLLEVELNGKMPPSARRVRPAGSTGTFYLDAVPPVRESIAIGDWRAATELNRLRNFRQKLTARFLYVETGFKTPSGAGPWYLESPVALGWIMLNGHVISLPGHVRRLNVSGLLNEPGKTNVIRWWPELIKETPTFDRVMQRRVPPLKLVR